MTPLHDLKRGFPATTTNRHANLPSWSRNKNTAVPESCNQSLEVLRIPHPQNGPIARPFRGLHQIFQRFNNYHFAVRCCFGTSVAVLAINMGFTLWAISKIGTQTTYGEIYKGDCSTAKKTVFWLHLLINALSTIVLAASNYCMQCLSSPTRKDIDKYHAKGIHLHISVPSYSNLRRISASKCILWFILAFSSIPLHLLYNSAVFLTVGTRSYTVYQLSNTLLSKLDSNPNLTSTSTFSGIGYDEIGTFRTYAEEWTKLENPACIGIYTAVTLSAYSDLLLLSQYGDLVGHCGHLPLSYGV